MFDTYDPTDVLKKACCLECIDQLKSQHQTTDGMFDRQDVAMTMSNRAQIIWEQEQERIRIAAEYVEEPEEPDSDED